MIKKLDKLLKVWYNIKVGLVISCINFFRKEPKVMAKVHVFPTNLRHSIISSLNLSRSEIDEIICIVKFKNGDSEVLETDSSFEFKCIAKELLDYEIKEEIDIDTE